MTRVTGSITLDLDTTRLADQLALRLVSALATEQLADMVARKVAGQVNADLLPFSGQAWHAEPVEPAWSGFCWNGEHDQCNGTAPPAKVCACPHHSEPLPDAEPVGSAIYERTADQGPAPRVTRPEDAGGFPVGRDVEPPAADLT